MSNLLKKRIYSENQHNVHYKCGLDPVVSTTGDATPRTQVLKGRREESGQPTQGQPLQVLVFRMSQKSFRNERINKMRGRLSSLPF